MNEISYFESRIKLSGILSFFERLTKREMETLSIISDVDLFQALLDSMNEAREGKVVTMTEAFQDLL